ncbi:hypothetical protein NDU88_005410 [Pleurodeles waltl]|uniref:Uncharacterized protein n=1 Tax=Pleurodeles waltl TaxID=8319 RepID=A0AAV7NMD2_PLEWA|nr:hypothetical protein NDU88_005410 [Pleurodeles waltl]
MNRERCEPLEPCRESCTLGCIQTVENQAMPPVVTQYSWWLGGGRAEQKLSRQDATQRIEGHNYLKQEGPRAPVPGLAREEQCPRPPPRLLQELSATVLGPSAFLALFLLPTRKRCPQANHQAKCLEKPHQLLFLDAVSQPRPISSSTAHPDNTATEAPAGTHSDTVMGRVLQEISAVGRRLEAMDSKITDLSAVSKSIRVDIASFQAKVMDLDHRLLAVETQVASLPDNEPELQYLRHKLTDLEDRSHRDNVRFFGMPEKVDFIPTITGLTFYPSLEFQGAHRIGPLHKQAVKRPPPYNCQFPAP